MSQQPAGVQAGRPEGTSLEFLSPAHLNARRVSRRAIDARRVLSAHRPEHDAVLWSRPPMMAGVLGGRLGGSALTIRAPSRFWRHGEF